MTTPPPPPPPPPQGPTGPQGYGAPGPYPPGYGAQPYGAQGQMREHPDGTTVLVLGILGLVVCGLLAPFAWVKGNKAKREMASQPNVYWSNQGSVTAGRICGIIGTVLILVGVAVFALFIVAAVASST